MSFLAPALLIASIAIAIPIILHLINFRRPNKQHFSTLVFFQQLQKSSIRWLKLKKLILLALRIAAILLLAIALARPFFTTGGFSLLPDRGTTLHAIILENSPAMEQIDEDGMVIDRARNAAVGIIENARQGDRFLVYNTHGALVSPDETGREQALRALQQVEPANAGNFTIERLRDLISRRMATDRDGAHVYYIGRGGKQLAQAMEGFEPPSGFRREMNPLTIIRTGEEPAGNTAITGISTPNQIISAGSQITIEAEVRNFSDTHATNQFLTLEVDGAIMGQYQVDLNPGEARSYTFNVQANKKGAVKGRALIEGDPFSFDNTRYFVIDVPEQRRVLLITEDDVPGRRASWVEPVFAAARQSSGQLDYVRIGFDNLARHPLSGFNAVVIEGVRDIPEYAWAELSDFVQQGGGLLIVPGHHSNPERYNRFLERLNIGRFIGLIGDAGNFEPVGRVDRIVRGHPIFDDMFEAAEEDEIRLEMPNLFHYWNFRASGSVQVIMRSNLGDPLLTQHAFGNGRVLVISTSPDPSWSAFAVNPVFAPLFFRTAMYAAVGESGGLNLFTLGSPFLWNLRDSHRQAEVWLGSLNLVPETTITRQGTRLEADTYEWAPGWAMLATERDTVGIAVNQHVSESDFATLAENELREIFSSVFRINRLISLAGQNDTQLARQIGVAGAGREIWNWFIVAALLFLIGESIVSRKFKGGNT